MKFQTILIAISAISTALACPTNKSYANKALKPTSSSIKPTSSSIKPTSPSIKPTSPSIKPTSPSIKPPSPSIKPTSSSISSSVPVPTKVSLAVDPSPSSGSSSSASSSSSSSDTITGEATFYGGNLNGGTCSFTTLSTIPNNMNGTAYSGQVWNSGAMCGACVEVTRNGKSIVAMIVDQCPECTQSHLDLFEPGFMELGTAAEGIIDIGYSVVDCGITSPLVLHNKSGTSAYWFSMQVVNANGAVAKLEVSTDGGSTWQGTTRKDYNFFENSSGFGTSTVSVRVTGASGAVVRVDNVGVASDSQMTASGNI